MTKENPQHSSVPRTNIQLGAPHRPNSQLGAPHRPNIHIYTRACGQRRYRAVPWEQRTLGLPG